MRDHPHGAGPDRQPTRVTLFLFATGIENSYPTIQNGRVRRDQMEECGHYRLWRRYLRHELKTKPELRS